MKHLVFFALTVFCIQKTSFAQSDTAIVYLTEFGDTTKQNAYTYTKFYKQDNLWHGKEYFIKTGILKSEGNYREKNFDHPVGAFKNYNEKGVLFSINAFNDSSRLLERTYFYENGMKQGWMLYTDSRNYEQKCWDSLGKEMPFCKIEIEARFKGGAQGWKKYLEKNLNANVGAESGAPAGNHKVEVRFAVNKNGEVSM
jgi:hypothetical protein